MWLMSCGNRNIQKVQMPRFAPGSPAPGAKGDAVEPKLSRRERAKQDNKDLITPQYTTSDAADALPSVVLATSTKVAGVAR